MTWQAQMKKEMVWLPTWKRSKQPNTLSCTLWSKYMAQSPKGGLVHGLYNPIHGDCAIYFYPGVIHQWINAERLDFSGCPMASLGGESVRFQLSLDRFWSHWRSTTINKKYTWIKYMSNIHMFISSIVFIRIFRYTYVMCVLSHTARHSKFFVFRWPARTKHASKSKKLGAALLEAAPWMIWTKRRDAFGSGSTPCLVNLGWLEMTGK